MPIPVLVAKTVFAERVYAIHPKRSVFIMAALLIDVSLAGYLGTVIERLKTGLIVVPTANFLPMQLLYLWASVVCDIVMFTSFAIFLRRLRAGIARGAV